MFKVFIKIYFFLLFISTACNSVKPKFAQAQKPYVILKLDDLWCKDDVVHPGWEKVISFLNEQEIKGTIGLIGESLEKENLEYFKWIKNREQEGHEIWNHGFCHCRDREVGISEFRGKSEEDQFRSIQQTQVLAEEKLGITLRTFGAPYNNTDQETINALEEISDLKVWLYKETELPTDKYIMDRIPEVNIEYPVHQPDYEKFVLGYRKNEHEALLVIQGHPRSWTEDESRFSEFKKIITFLQKEQVEFITPYEYYRFINGGK